MNLLRQLRGGGENQEDEEMKILNTSKKENRKEHKYNSKLHFLGQLGLINRGRFLPRTKIIY